MNDDPELIRDILEVERKWVQAHQELDLDSIRKILAEDYRQIQSDGTVIGKQDLIQSYGSGLRQWVIAESDDYEVRLLGEVALLIGRWRGKGENAGKSFDYTARFLAVYRLVDGDWKLVADVSIPMEG